ncbi:methyl-accepting chemotaxis protein, partial [Pseudoxanthomonas beigongshangi]
SAGIEQVNQTITQMDETTQQNAAVVEEASAAARSMEQQAQSLAEAVSVFELDDLAPAPVAVAVAAPRAATAPATRPAPPRQTPAAIVEAALATEGEDWQEF